MSKPSKPRRRAGRPGNRAMQFGARLFVHYSGYTENHCRALLREEGVSHIGAREWYLVARAIELGIETLDDFEEWLHAIGYFEQ